MASFQQYKDQILVGAVTILGGMIWADVREMKQDMKTLLQQVAIHDTKIANLEREVFKTSAYKVPVPPIDQRQLPLKHEMVAILRDENLTPIDDETFN